VTQFLFATRHLITYQGKQHLTEFLETVKLMIAEKEEEAMNDVTKRDNDLLYKIRHMRDVLERWKIVGLNRKLQVSWIV
jgi:hypothetical protein